MGILCFNLSFRVHHEYDEPIGSDNVYYYKIYHYVLLFTTNLVCIRATRDSLFGRLAILTRCIIIYATSSAYYSCLPTLYTIRLIAFNLSSYF